VIRRAKPEDAGRIAEIHIFGWRNAYRGMGRPALSAVEMRYVKPLAPTGAIPC